MAGFARSYDFSNEPPPEPRTNEPLPAGEYLAQIISNEEKTAKSGGSYHEFTWEILGGPHASRKLWVRLNLGSHNSTAAEIAERDLNAMCAAVGKRQVADGDELMFQPMVIRVTVRPPQNGYGASNEVRGYKAAQGASQPRHAPPQRAATHVAPAPVSAPQAAPGGPGGGRPLPWAKKSAA